MCGQLFALCDESFRAYRDGLGFAIDDEKPPSEALGDGRGGARADEPIRDPIARSGDG